MAGSLSQWHHWQSDDVISGVGASPCFCDEFEPILSMLLNGVWCLIEYWAVTSSGQIFYQIVQWRPSTCRREENPYGRQVVDQTIHDLVTLVLHYMLASWFLFFIEGYKAFSLGLYMKPLHKKTSFKNLLQKTTKFKKRSFISTDKILPIYRTRQSLGKTWTTGLIFLVVMCSAKATLWLIFHA